MVDNGTEIKTKTKNKERTFTRTTNTSTRTIYTTSTILVSGSGFDPHLPSRTLQVGTHASEHAHRVSAISPVCSCFILGLLWEYYRTVFMGFIAANCAWRLCSFFNLDRSSVGVRCVWFSSTHINSVRIAASAACRLRNTDSSGSVFPAVNVLLITLPALLFIFVCLCCLFLVWCCLLARTALYGSCESEAADAEGELALIHGGVNSVSSGVGASVGEEAKMVLSQTTLPKTKTHANLTVTIIPQLQCPALLCHPGLI